MRLAALFGTRRQQEFHLPHDINDLSPTGSWIMCTLAGSAAVALIISVAAQNIAHSYSLGLASSEFRALVLALASAGASVLGPCAWLAVARGRGFGTRLIALVMAIGCLLFAGLCSLGFTAGSRDQAVVEHAAIADAYADKRSIATAARVELASLATIKTPSKTVIERRRDLAKILSDGGGAKGVAAAAAGHDSQAAAVAAYLTAAGHPVTAEAAGRWINFGTVAFLEIAAAWSLTIAAALRPARRPRPVGAPAAPALPAEPQLPAKPEKPATAAPARRQRHDDDDPAPPKPRNKGGRPVKVIPAEVLARLRAKGGRVSGSLNGIGKAIGSTSKSTTHRVLHQLAGAGLLSMTTTPRGIAVAVA